MHRRKFAFILPVFQSTLPVGGATFRHSAQMRIRNISIHAPRGGSDLSASWYWYAQSYFNPRSPWGERHCMLHITQPSDPFQSTLPVGGSDLERLARGGSRYGISIHAPRGGSDLKTRIRITHAEQFQSTLPVGGATGSELVNTLLHAISIHAPRGGSDPVFGKPTV